MGKNLLLATLLFGCSVARAEVEVATIKVPDGGIQPQAVTDRTGNVHLIYFKGDPASGDLYYSHKAKEGEFSKGVRVNSVPGSVLVTGSVRGGQIAVGRDGFVHVVWYGSSKVKTEQGAPLLYSRSKDGTAFEEQLSLLGKTKHLDGGASVAADEAGKLMVIWHAAPKESEGGELKRRVFAVRSDDDGKSFTSEKEVAGQGIGACACCGLKAFAANGSYFFLYRGAENINTRDIHFFAGTDETAFKGSKLHPWKIAACPMSTMAFASAGKTIVACWETEGQIYYSQVEPSGTFSEPKPMPGKSANRKHPTVALLPSGEMLVAWAEGTGWNRGGDLVWQLFDSAGLANKRGRVEKGVPVWGLPSAIATAKGFVVIH